MQVGYLYDPVFLEHDDSHHPENRARLEAIMALLRREGLLNQLANLPFTPATNEQLAMVHDPAYLFALEHYAARGGGMLDLNTYVNSASFRAAVTAAGAAIAASRAVMGVGGAVSRAFALVRPPGHHAYADQAGGFCLLNNVAFAALEALGQFSDDRIPRVERAVERAVDRVAVVDFDVHHGNGTQDIFYADPRVLYVSTHESPLFPGTGQIEETGAGNAIGTNVNIPLPSGVGDNGYARVFDEIITPIVRRFKPGLILVSAGYDAHWLDQIAMMSVSLGGFAQMMSRLVSLSEELCAGHLVVILEGGYDLEALSYGVLNTFHVLGGAPDRVTDPLGPPPGRETSIDKLIAQIRRVHEL